MKPKTLGDGPQDRHDSPGSTQGGNRPYKSYTAADLAFYGLDRCDLCGGHLPVEDRLAGLCVTCMANMPEPLGGDQ